MTFKPVLRYDPSWPKLRLFRVMWDAPEWQNGDFGGGGYSRKIAVALRPRLFAWERSFDGWRVCLGGASVIGKIFVDIPPRHLGELIMRAQIFGRLRAANNNSPVQTRARAAGIGAVRRALGTGGRSSVT